RSLYVCILDQAGETLVHRKLPCDRDELLRVLKAYREDLVVGVECLFCWYWVADLCDEQGIPFVLGHALYMKAIHSGKSKNDRIDSYKITSLLKGASLRARYEPHFTGAPNGLVSKKLCGSMSKPLQCVKAMPVKVGGLRMGL